MRSVIRAMIASAPAVAAVSAPVVARATTWYVGAGAGRDANSGRTATSAFATLQHAESVTAPGDTVAILNGTYTNTAAGGNILDITRSGTASAWITYEAAAGQHPVLAFTDSWAAINLVANYVAIEGLTITGNARTVTLAYGQSQDRNLLNPITNGDGIDVSPSAASATHHILLEGNTIHDVPGNGIEVYGADYVTIEGNTIYDTSWWSPYGDSAISLYESRDSDAATTYKNFIVGNTTYGNAEYFPCSCRDYASISDGNGIIIDDNENTQANNVAYHGRTLIALNVSYGNGGSGIHAYASQHVDIVDNTAYGNNTTGSINEGQIFSNTGSDINITNNILEAPPGKSVITNVANSATVVDSYNLFWSTSGKPVLPIKLGVHDLESNPMFVAPTAGNFALTLGSPAIRTGAAVVLTGALPAPLTTSLIAAHNDRGAY